MEVLILNSPLFKEYNKLYDEDSLPPIGLGYIATHLKENNISVQLIDAVNKRIPLAELISYINQVKPEFIASNIFTTNYPLVEELFNSISYPAHFIIGGLSTRELYKFILDWPSQNPVDIVIGDGEFIVADIIRNTLKESPAFEKGNRRVFKTVDTSVYFNSNISETPLDREFLLNEPVHHPLGFVEANIVTSRGCIYNCTFCAAARSQNGDFPVREKSEQSIIDELNSIKRYFPEVDSIRVLDDLFLTGVRSVQKAIAVFSIFNFRWRAMAHVMTFQSVEERMMDQLRETGCFELFMGIESGSPRILKQIKKTHNIEQIIRNLTKVFKAGIHVKGYFIYGFPGETADDMEQTFLLAKTLKEISLEYKVNFRTSVFQYRPYHASQIYHELELKGQNTNSQEMEPNHELSNLVGRLQFNFHTGNFSEVEIDLLHTYIYRTINLNDGKIFAGLQ